MNENEKSLSNLVNNNPKREVNEAESRKAIKVRKNKTIKANNIPFLKIDINLPHIIKASLQIHSEYKEIQKLERMLIKSSKTKPRNKLIESDRKNRGRIKRNRIFFIKLLIDFNILIAEISYNKNWIYNILLPYIFIALLIVAL